MAVLVVRNLFSILAHLEVARNGIVISSVVAPAGFWSSAACAERYFSLKTVIEPGVKDPECPLTLRQPRRVGADRMVTRVLLSKSTGHPAFVVDRPPPKYRSSCVSAKSPYVGRGSSAPDSEIFRTLRVLFEEDGPASACRHS